MVAITMNVKLDIAREVIDKDVSKRVLMFFLQQCLCQLNALIVFFNITIILYQTKIITTNLVI